MPRLFDQEVSISWLCKFIEKNNKVLIFGKCESFSVKQVTITITFNIIVSFSFHNVMESVENEMVPFKIIIEVILVQHLHYLVELIRCLCEASEIVS